MTITGFAGAELLSPERRADLLAVFKLPEAEKAKLLRWNFDPTKKNLYRGWFPLQHGVASHKEGIDMGPDITGRPCAGDVDDPLCEPTPLPRDDLVPGWRETAAGYFLAMEETGEKLTQSLARGLGLPETIFDAAFVDGNSTLRLTRYPVRDDEAALDEKFLVEHKGKTRAIMGAAHIDSGFMTLLAQDGVEGLQAKNHEGEWIDVPPADGTLAVNFGRLIQRWTDGRVRATLHRVIAPGRERFSIPFFYEPRVDAEITPLPLAGAGAFDPFLYGDYLWDATTNFVEQKGIRHLREPRRKTA
jgi:isopenicillin N synthase-like dioxygenase